VGESGRAGWRERERRRERAADALAMKIQFELSSAIEETSEETQKSSGVVAVRARGTYTRASERARRRG